VGKLIYNLNVSLDGFIETPDPLGLDRGRRRAPPLVQRADATARRHPLRVETRTFESGVMLLSYAAA
jgi:hypothetical protein